MSAPCCDVVACGGRCGAQVVVAPSTSSAARARAVVRPWRLRLARGMARWWAGGWRPVVPVTTWWSERAVSEMPF